MGDDSLSTPVTLNRVGGTHTFKRCRPADLMALRSVFRTYRKVWRARSLEVLGITGKDALPYLDELDARRVRESHVLEWLNEPEGQNEAILLSLQIDNPKADMADVYALNLDPDDRLTVAAGVLNRPVSVGPAKEDAPGGTPLAESPASGGTGTGQETPAKSPTTAGAATP